MYDGLLVRRSGLQRQLAYGSGRLQATRLFRSRSERATYDGLLVRRAGLQRQLAYGSGRLQVTRLFRSRSERATYDGQSTDWKSVGRDFLPKKLNPRHSGPTFGADGVGVALRSENPIEGHS
jgi:hypothetical protein